MLFATLAWLKTSVRLAFLAIIFFIFLAFCLALPASAQTRVVRSDVQHDLSPPLRDLVKNAPSPEAEPQQEAEELHLIPLGPGYKPAEAPDPVLQSAVSPNATDAPALANLGPTMIRNFDGIGQGVANFSVRFAPPDTNGAVGLTQYVQWVNVNFAVYDKATGNLLAGPTAGNTLWSGFGGGCESNNDGDPIVMYDKLADRWVFTQFVVRNNSGGFGPVFLQCVAVSKTSDATGQFFRYSFQYSAFDDYPKMGLWPDAYYVTFNMFDGVSLGFLGADACAYDRNAMLNGQPAAQVCFQQVRTIGSLLPSDMDGLTPPPAGSPNYMMEFDVNSLNLYKFHVDFTTPANSTFSAATNIPVSPFTPLCNGSRGCVPQPPGDGTLLDSLADRLMYRLAYRNFGDHESLVVNHSVAVSQSSGLRWYEIRNPNGTPTVFQQSTFAPDASFRWMGSIAMDHAGDIALGYSVSSSTVFPSIAVTGRVFSDPLNTLQPEITIMAGTGSQTNFLTRWGDYSAMQVDPVDDCTFWYTQEYIKANGSFNWNTRIASFKFPICDKPDLTITSTHSGNFTQDQVGAVYTLSVTNSGGKDTDGSMVTVTDTLPTGVTVTAASGTGWSCTPGSTTTCTRSDILTANTNYPDITVTMTVTHDAPGFITNSATVAGGGEQNTGNDSASDVTTVIQLGPDPTIAKSHSGTFVQGQTGAYTMIVKNVGLSPLDGTTVTVTDTLPTGLSASTASGTGWGCTPGTPTTTCTRTDALASNASYPPITLTVNVAGNAPLSVTNTVVVSGGGNVNTLNDTASDPTTIVPPPPDVSITKTHNGNFNQGQTFAPYTVTVSNAAGSIPTSGTVTVVDTLPSGGGLTFVTAFGSNWFCIINTPTQATCTRTDPLAGGNSYPAITFTVNVDNNAPASAINTVKVSGGGDVTPGNNTATDSTTINPSPDLTLTKSHTGDFTVNQSGIYSIVVNNIGNASTSGTVNVTDSLPLRLLATNIAGTGWSCSTPPVQFVSCTRSDALAAGASYPAITLTVSVNSGPSVTNTAIVNGGGEFNTSNDFASDPTNINAPNLSITKTHSGNFTVGQAGTYTITVGNVGQVATIGTSVGVIDSLPTGMTATAVSGTNWTCSGSTFINCTTFDVLAPNKTYPPITLTVAVDGSASANEINFAGVSGGGDGVLHTASDPTTINLPDLAITKTHSGTFTAGQTGVAYTITVSNVGTVATAGGTVFLQDGISFNLNETGASGAGWTCPSVPTSFVTCSRPAGTLAPGDSYPPITLTADVSFFAVGSVINTASVSGIGDANFNNNSASDNAPISQPVGITPTSSTNVNVTAGSAATFTFNANLSTNPSVGTVNFSVNGVPPNAKATLSSTSLTQSGTVTLTLDTSGGGHVAASLQPFGGGRLAVIYAGLFFPVFGLLLLKVGRKRRIRPWIAAATCISGLALALAFSGCGGSKGLPPPPPVTTPPGTYFVTTTATSSNVNVRPVSMGVTVVVR